MGLDSAPMFAGLEETVRRAARRGGAPDFPVVSEIPPSPEQGGCGLPRGLRTRPPAPPPAAGHRGGTGGGAPGPRRGAPGGGGRAGVCECLSPAGDAAGRGESRGGPDPVGGGRRAGAHRRAHLHQPQQGRAHRPFAQRKRSGTPSPAFSASWERGWKYRTTLMTPGCRSRMSRSVSRCCAGRTRARCAASRGSPASTTSAGTSMPRRPAGSRPIRRARRSGGRPSAASSAAKRPWAEIGAAVAEAVARRHLETMERIGVRYDLLPCEKTVLAAPLLGPRLRAAAREGRDPAGANPAGTGAAG